MRPKKLDSEKSHYHTYGSRILPCPFHLAPPTARVTINNEPKNEDDNGINFLWQCRHRVPDILFKLSAMQSPWLRLCNPLKPAPFSHNGSCVGRVSPKHKRLIWNLVYEAIRTRNSSTSTTNSGLSIQFTMRNSHAGVSSLASRGKRVQNYVSTQAPDWLTVFQDVKDSRLTYSHPRWVRFCAYARKTRQEREQSSVQSLQCSHSDIYAFNPWESRKTYLEMGYMDLVLLLFLFTKS
jgi:hypothetical protein